MIKKYELMEALDSLIYNELFSCVDDGCVVLVDTDKLDNNKIILTVDDYSNGVHEQYKYKIIVEDITEWENIKIE